MKISLLFLLISLLVFSSKEMTAQTRMGVTAGPAASYFAVNGKESMPKDGKLGFGFNAGLFMDSPLSSKFTSEIELKYMQYRNGLAFMKDGIVRHYIYAPLTVKYFPIENWSLNFGTDLGFLVGSSSNWKSITDNIIDLGIHAGTSYAFTDDLSVGIRYMHGISKPLEFKYTDENGADIGSENYLNRLFEVNFKYAFVEVKKKNKG